VLLLSCVCCVVNNVDDVCMFGITVDVYVMSRLMSCILLVVMLLLFGVAAAV